MRSHDHNSVSPRTGPPAHRAQDPVEPLRRARARRSGERRLRAAPQLAEARGVQARAGRECGEVRAATQRSEPATGATRSLAATITALLAERAERDKLECAVNNLFADASAMAISPQPDTLSACSVESCATTSAASSGSSAGASGAGERRALRVPWLPQRRPQQVQCVQERRVLQQGVPTSAPGRAQGRLQGHEPGEQDMKESRCRGVVVTWYSSCSLPPLRTFVVCAARSERVCHTAESNASHGPMQGLEALDRDILVIPEPVPHDVQHVGCGSPLLLPRCSAARAGSAVHSRAAPPPAAGAPAPADACPLDLPAPHARAARCTASALARKLGQGSP
jgi:hypothetical protein